MFKRIVFGSLVLVLAMGLMRGFVFVPSCFAQESITITTYYPSPYGVYNELQTNKFAVGDTDGSGNLNAGDQPPEKGQLYTARSVIYKPQGSLPAFNARKGELVYNDSDNALYLYTGASWVKQGGGGGCYVTYSGTCLPGFTKKEDSIGWWGRCVHKTVPPISHFHPPGGDCDHEVRPENSEWMRVPLGRAFVCCQ